MAEMTPGSVIDGRYETLEVLGSGGVGVVYKARDLDRGGEVALKVLKKGVKQEEHRRRFMREFHMLSRIRHPRVMRTHTWGVHEGRPYFSMDYLQGQTLASMISDNVKKEVLRGSGFLRLVRQIADGLTCIHGQGLLHLDLKPSNIMIVEQDHRIEAAILDLGLAHSGSGRAVSLTGDVSATGTAEYMSPEQGRGGRVDERSDLYSLGIVLYEILAGAPPFTGDSPAAVILRHLGEQPRPLQALEPKQGMPVLAIVMKLLAKEPIDRFRSARELLAGLDAIVSEGALPKEEPGPAGTRLPEPPLVGREREVKAMRKIISGAYEGRRQTVLVTGHPGMGKSRLMEAVKGDAALYGMEVLSGACRQDRREVHLPLIDALRNVLRLELVSDTGSTDACAALERIWHHLRKLARNRPVLLCIEDLQWSDELTDRFLRRCRSDAEDFPLMILVTCPGVGSTSMDGHKESLFRDGGTGRIHEIHLGCLTRTETARLAASILGERRIPEKVGGRLFEETGGCPLFVVESVRTLVAEGVVRDEGEDGWRWDSIPAGLMPDRAVEVLRRRLEVIHPIPRRVLDYASVCASGFTFDLIEGVWRESGSNLVEILDDLVRLDLLRKSTGAGAPYEYRLSSMLLRRTIYNSLDAERRILLHRAVARTLEVLNSESRPQAVEDLAFHYLKSGEVEKADQYLIQAGKQALSADRALSMFKDVSEPRLQGDDLSAVPIEKIKSRVRFLCDYSNALSSRGYMEEAKEKAQDALSLVSETTPGERALVLCQFGIVYARSRSHPEAERAFLDAIAIYRKHGPRKRERETRLCLASLYERMERREEARVQIKLISEDYVRAGGALSRSRASYFSGYIAHLDGRLGDAHTLFESALERAKKVGDRAENIGNMNLIGTTAFRTGNYQRAEEIFQSQQLSNLDWRRTATGGVSHFYLGSIALEKKDAKTAVVFGEKAVEILSHIRDAHQVYWVFGLMAEAHAALGNADEAVRWADRARPGTQMAGETPTVAWRGIGVALAAAKRCEEAEDAFKRAIANKPVIQRFEWFRSLLAAGRFYLGHGNLDMARLRLEAAERKAEALQTPFYARKASNLLSRLARLEAQSESRVSAESRPIYDRIAAVSELAADLGGGLDLPSLMERTLDGCLKVAGAEKAIVVFKDAQSGGLRIEATRSGEGGNATSKGINRGVVRRAIENNEPVFGADALADKRFKKRQSVFDFDVRSVACVPLYHREAGSLGALYLDLRGFGNAVSDADRRFLIALAGLLSAGVIQARMSSRLKERALYRARDESGRKGLGELVGVSRVMQAVYRLIERAARTDMTVLIQGETGTGKELAARAIHDNSVVKDCLFLSQNCGALSGELLYSELFGHKRGSFTGAVSDRTGLFETAQGGTVFLDEIADAAPEVQASLLRVLQNGEVRRVGESVPRRVNVRIIAATNADLEAEVSKGAFRKDLFYRLQVLPIKMPALKDRKDDIPLLAGHLLRNAAREAGKTVEGFTEGAVKALMKYDWPGNVRQLDNEIRLAVALVENGGVFEMELLSERLRPEAGWDDGAAGTLRAFLQSVEKRYLSQVLDMHNGNVTRTALELGLTRSGLYKKLERHGLRGP